MRLIPAPCVSKIFSSTSLKGFGTLFSVHFDAGILGHFIGCRWKAYLILKSLLLDTMEVVAAVASVAGILNLLGESLDGTRKLRNFFCDMSSASSTIASLLQDIDLLLQAIQSVRDLVEKLPREFPRAPIASLRSQVKNYTKDVSRWLETAEALHPASDNGMKTWLKKLLVAVHSKSVNQMMGELDRHIQAFSLSLSIIGR